MKLTTAINRVGLSGSNNCCCFMFYIIHNYEQNGIGNILQKFIVCGIFYFLILSVRMIQM